MVGVLKGGARFANALQSALYKLQADVPIDYMQMSSYGQNRESSHHPTLVKDIDPKVNLSQLHVIVAEDLIDGGWTLQEVVRILGLREPLSLMVIALLAKVDQVQVAAQVDMVGFRLSGNPWIEGFGIDSSEFGRGRDEVVEILPD